MVYETASMCPIRPLNTCLRNMEGLVCYKTKFETETQNICPQMPLQSDLRVMKCTKNEAFVQVKSDLAKIWNYEY